MSTPTIAQDIARGLEIRKEIAALEEELEAIETRLTAAAEQGPHVPLEEAEREGKQWKGRSGKLVLPVRFESDQLLSSFAVDSPVHRELAGIAGSHFSTLFRRVAKFERKQSDGNKFRQQLRALLEPEPYANFIKAATSRDKLGIAKSKTVIAWDHTVESAAS